MTTLSKPALSPSIVRESQAAGDGIRPQVLSSPMIGYVVRGRKHIYYGDQRYEVQRGDLFYLPPGQHYTEALPEQGKTFEQISFFYSTSQLAQTLSLLSMNFRFTIENDHTCAACREKNHAIYPAWNAVRHFFDGIARYLREGSANQDETVTSLKMTELIYLILSRSDSCLTSKILENIDLRKENFEQIIRKNIFNTVSIEALARLCNRSLTSFKKEFKRNFYEPPHKWFIRQRLMHARLLLISTGKPVAVIGKECNFPNTSHFIKLFKKEFGVTPAVYRNQQTRQPGSNAGSGWSSMTQNFAP